MIDGRILGACITPFYLILCNQAPWAGPTGHLHVCNLHEFRQRLSNEALSFTSVKQNVFRYIVMAEALMTTPTRFVECGPLNLLQKSHSMREKETIYDITYRKYITRSSANAIWWNPTTMVLVW